jgi:hypothetical protein
MKTRVKVEYVIDYELSAADSNIEALNFVPKDARSIKSEAWLLKESQPKPVEPPAVLTMPDPKPLSEPEINTPIPIPEGMCPEGCGHLIEEHGETGGCLASVPKGTGVYKSAEAESDFCKCKWNAPASVVEAPPEPAPESIPVPVSDDTADVRPIGDTEPAF